MSALAQLLAVALFLGLDSLRASIGLSSAGLVGAHPARLALAFGLCDAGAPLAGLTVGHALLDQRGPLLDSLGPVLLAGCAVYAVLASGRARRGSTSDTFAVVAGVPVALSLDNLVAGATLGVYGFPIVVSALVLGATSGLLSMVGSAIGHVLECRLTARMELAGAALLFVVALSFAAEGL